MPLAPEIDQALKAAVPDIYAVITPPLAVAEPPCRRCDHWNPVILTGTDGSFAGIKLCHAKAMYSDFSCHAPRKY